ncbi:MAG TPA: hypothetical protein VL379_12415 [Pseudomonadales bacterium]|jgi:uncharacterized membrane protein|nr:hypothetical protein [Pseudomonadales bacterium]
MNGRQLTGAAFAMAAASFFATMPATAADAATPSATATGVHCYGVNSCKGQNDCKTDQNACKGQGSCQGMGFTTMKSAQECVKAGGKVGN